MMKSLIQFVYVYRWFHELQKLAEKIDVEMPRAPAGVDGAKMQKRVGQVATVVDKLEEKKGMTDEDRKTVEKL